ncbi:hypothetical protein QBC38DRAFT_146790 [Podospora fimiseda]|uniref:Uncharacterized protein n=1 Tax=Podospora fimiseda TaxID=252190 RepID=A0AAN7BYU1_9PEZI|nr:hypothetical protein QBC38DRAFT_146790 [Podospora fimiseda]
MISQTSIQFLQSVTNLCSRGLLPGGLAVYIPTAVFFLLHCCNSLAQPSPNLTWYHFHPIFMLRITSIFLRSWL